MFGYVELKLLMVAVLAFLSYRAAKKTRENLTKADKPALVELKTISSDAHLNH